MNEKKYKQIVEERLRDKPVEFLKAAVMEMMATPNPNESENESFAFDIIFETSLVILEKKMKLEDYLMFCEKLTEK